MSFNISEFYEREAEEGSDNENHDDVVKSIKDSEEDETREDDLEELTEKYTEKNLEINKIIKKYKDEEIQRDKEKIIEIIKSGFEPKKRKYSELSIIPHIPNCLVNRIKKMSKEEKHIKFRKELCNISKHKRSLIDNAEDYENLEEVSDLLENYENEIKHKITTQSSDMKKRFIERINENSKILENVINLNKEKVVKKNTVSNKYNLYSNNHFNSFLNAIKNDKYKSNSYLSDKRSQIQGNVFSVFVNVKNSTIDSDQKAKFQKIFKDKKE